jgi:hypothetical protein
MEVVGDSQGGLHVWSARASMKRWRKTMLPSFPAGLVRAVVAKPCAVTRAA